MATNKADTTPANLEANAPEGLALTDKEQIDARKEGAKEAVKESAKDSYIGLTDGVQPGEPAVDRWPGKSEIQQWAHLIDWSIDDLKKAFKNGDVPDEKVAGLLALERAGQNRTDWVKLFMKQIGVDSPYEVTDAGPPYTNDTTSVTKL